MSYDLEKLIDEMANRVQHGRDISHAQTNPTLAPFANLMVKLSSFPKSILPKANFNAIRNQVLDKISIPADLEVMTDRASFWSTIPYIVRMSAGMIGTLLIIISLGIGTAVAALQSVPGDAIYPLKKVVENIELNLTTDRNAKANLQIQFANNRLDELTQVLEKNQAGEFTGPQAQKIVADTINDLRETTAAALSATSKSNNPKVSTLTKIVDLSNKQVAVLKPLLSAATIRNEGEVKIVLQQALETSIDSKQQAIKNIEDTGAEVTDSTANTPTSNKVDANGKITTITLDSVSIGTSKFLLTKDTQYIGIKPTDLKVDVAITISGEVQDDKKTYALIISPVNTKTQEPTVETQTDTTTTNTTDTSASTTVKP